MTIQDLVWVTSSESALHSRNSNMCSRACDASECRRISAGVMVDMSNIERTATAPISVWRSRFKRSVRELVRSSINRSDRDCWMIIQEFDENHVSTALITIHQLTRTVDRMGTNKSTRPLAQSFAQSTSNKRTQT